LCGNCNEEALLLVYRDIALVTTGVESCMAQDILILKTCLNTILSTMGGAFPTIEDTATLICRSII